MTGMRNRAAVLDGIERTKRACVHCGRICNASGIVTHEPACSPEGREARRLRAIGFSARYRHSHARRPDPRGSCPDCGAEIVASSARCRVCADARRPRRSVAERFWEKVDKSGGPDACWPFKGALSHGYGRLAIPGQTGDIASRVAYRLSVADPGALDVLHRCDNPPCCNPAHLFLGTALDNMHDMIAKGRASWQKSA